MFLYFFFAALAFAHLALWVALIRARPSGEMRRLARDRLGAPCLRALSLHTLCGPHLCDRCGTESSTTSTRTTYCLSTVSRKLLFRSKNARNDRLRLLNGDAKQKPEMMSELRSPFSSGEKCTSADDSRKQAQRSWSSRAEPLYRCSPGTAKSPSLPRHAPERIHSPAARGGHVRFGI